MTVIIKEQHYMLDSETLGRTGHRDNVLLELSLVRFEPLADYGVAELLLLPNLLIRFDLDTQYNAGRYIDPKTLLWWLRTDAALLRDLMTAPNRRTILTAAEEIVSWTNGHADNSFIWAHGISFDEDAIASIFEQAGNKPFWQYNRVRDARTMGALPGVLSEDSLFAQRPEFRKHHAYHDNLAQIERLTKRLRRIQAGLTGG